MTLEPALLGVAATFAVATGVNDGGALLSANLKVLGFRLVVAGALLTAFVAIGPAVFGTGVATTFVKHLVVFSGMNGRLAVLVAVAAAVAVVTVLTLYGLPTSLTLAVLGAVAGAGVGYGLPVSWGVIGLVLLVGALAPFVGAGLAYLITRVMRVVSVRASAGRVLRRGHQLAFGLQCFAYSVNDGQKVLAVVAIAMGTVSAPVRVTAPQMGLIAALFGTGVLLGLPRVARTLSSGVLAVRQSHAVSAEVAAAGAVLGTAALGAPVSMTQALTGGLVGAGMSDGYGRVRWRAAGRLGLAWLVTLPAGFGLAVLAGWIVRAWVG